MLSILNDSFVYDKETDRFTNSIVILSIRRRTDELLYKTACGLTSSHKCDICYEAFVADRHPECIKVMNNILNNTPIAHMKVHAGSFIDTVSIYGLIKGDIITRAGSGIEVWNAQLDIYESRENIYDYVYASLREQYPVYCVFCNNDAQGYQFYMYNLCVVCMVNWIAFKNELLSKYTLLAHLMYSDIGAVIITKIINIYKDIAVRYML